MFKTKINWNDISYFLLIVIFLLSLVSTQVTAGHVGENQTAETLTLGDVVERYTSTDIPQVPSVLTVEEQSSIVEYLESL